MATGTLYSLSAIAGVIAGVCIILGALFSTLVKSSSPVGAFFNFLGALIGLFGITGIYLWQSSQAGVFGLIAYVLLFIGLALIACVDYSGTLISASLSMEDMARLDQGTALQIKSISGLIFLVGEILFSISVILAGVFSSIAAILFLIGFLATPLRQSYPIVTFIGLTLSGIGIIWWCVSLWSMAGGL
jgi:hypothetical protein